MARSKPPRRKPSGPKAGQGRVLALCEMELELAEERMELVGRLLHLADEALTSVTLEEIEEVRTRAVRRILGNNEPLRDSHKTGSVLQRRHRLFDYPVLSRLAVLSTPVLYLSGQECWQLYVSAPKDALNAMPEHEGFFLLLLAEAMGESRMASEIRERWAFH